LYIRHQFEIVSAQSLSIERNPFSANNQTLRSYHGIYFAYWVRIISSAQCMMYKIELNKTHKQWS